MLVITAITASAIGVLTLVLTFRVIRLRRSQRVSVGAGDSEDLLRAIRSHGNLLEYAPLALILLGIAEINGAPRWLLAIVAVALVAGRVIHPGGMKDNKPGKGRVLGMQLTLSSILFLSALNVCWLIYRLVSG